MSEMYRFPCGCEWPIVGAPSREGALPFIDVDLNNLPECQAVWDLLATGRTKGVFQLESNLGQTWCKKLKPESIEHMGALAAILRPGCLGVIDENGQSVTEKYCLRKNGLQEATPIHPALSDLLRPTYGLMLYQEQMTKIAGVLADFDLNEQNKLRKAASKKSMAEMDLVGLLFVKKAATKGIVPPEEAEKIFEDIKKSGRYLFNRCVSEDTIIRRMPGSQGSDKLGDLPVSVMYKLKHRLVKPANNNQKCIRYKWDKQGDYGKGLSVGQDGRVRPNRIVDIQPSGYRPVLRVICEGDQEVRLTDNHKIPTSHGEVAVSEAMRLLAIGETVTMFVRGDYDPENTTGDTYAFSELSREDLAMRGAGKKVNYAHGWTNWGYTNGSFSEFKKNDRLIPRVCNRCEATNCRLELDHRDGDRTNSSLENLERLCVSCHKKKEYTAGRIRKGQKGYPTVSVRILSIVPDGECETYDVTMEAPNHNFVVNDGLVVCNSHAISYGIKGFKTAYQKAHIFLPFMCSWLRHASEKADPRQEILELVDDAKLMDVEVLPPLVSTLKPKISTDGVSVWFGLTDIKGVGDQQAINLKKVAAARVAETGRAVSEWTWEEFLYHCSDGVNTTSMKGWIASGGFSWTGKTRARQGKEYDAWCRLTDHEKNWIRHHASSLPFTEALRSMARMRKEGGGCATAKRVELVKSEAAILEQGASSDIDHPNIVASDEENYLGVALTASRIDACDTSMINCTCREFLAGKAGRIIMGVEIKSAIELKTKKGKNPGSIFGRLTITDGNCSVDAVCWSEQWQQYSRLFRPKNTVLLEGYRDDQYGSFVIRKAWQL